MLPLLATLLPARQFTDLCDTHPCPPPAIPLQVIAATPPCSTTLKAAGSIAAADTFQILVKKSGVPLANSFTVVRCGRGQESCYTYRLAKPCPRGRCLVEPDRTLAEGVFSVNPSPLGLT